MIGFLAHDANPPERNGSSIVSSSHGLRIRQAAWHRKRLLLCFGECHSMCFFIFIHPFIAKPLHAATKHMSSVEQTRQQLVQHASTSHSSHDADERSNSHETSRPTCHDLLDPLRSFNPVSLQPPSQFRRRRGPPAGPRPQSVEPCSVGRCNSSTQCSDTAAGDSGRRVLKCHGDSPHFDTILLLLDGDDCDNGLDGFRDGLCVRPVSPG